MSFPVTITITTPRQAGDTYEFTMLNDHGYALPVGQTHIVLSVKASNDAHICLTSANTSKLNLRRLAPEVSQLDHFFAGLHCLLPC